jgi:2-methylcitrate dehydratase PrpD
LDKSRHSGDLTVTERIAEFAASAAGENIPDEAFLVAKNAFLDWLGVTIAGSREPGSRLIAEYARRSASQPEAGVIGLGFKTTVELAALVNGTSSHAIDYDDTFPDLVKYNLHPSVCLFPAVLALAEKQRLSGRQLLQAYIVGLEVIYRIGSAMGQINSKYGWHPTPVIGTIGAAAAASSALRLDPSRAGCALGIAASLSGGLLKNFGSMTKPLHAGNAARNGVFATQLAAAGFTANSQIFDDENGFPSMFADKQLIGLKGAESDLGRSWLIASIGLVFKPYPSCRSTHSSIDAALYLRNKYHPQSDQVASVVCRISPMHTRTARFHRPETGYQGKFSIPYCIAAALVSGSLTMADFTDEKVKAPEARELLSKVTFQYPEGENVLTMDLASTLTVIMKNGDQFSHSVTLPRGEPGYQLSDQELTDKFKSCAGQVFDQASVQSMIEVIRRLDGEPDLTRLFNLLEAAGRAG